MSSVGWSDGDRTPRARRDSVTNGSRRARQRRRGPEAQSSWLCGGVRSVAGLCGWCVAGCVAGCGVCRRQPVNPESRRVSGRLHVAGAASPLHGSVTLHREFNPRAFVDVRLRGQNPSYTPRLLVAILFTFPWTWSPLCLSFAGFLNVNRP